MRTAASELPPRSKKLSSTPTSSSCNSSHQRFANCFSVAVRGAIKSWATSGRLPSGQGLAIEFGIRGQGKFLQTQEDSGDHVVRQHGLEGLNQRGRTQAGTARVVGDQALIAGTILSKDDDGLSDSLDFGKHALDLAQFDAKTVELHLVVETPQKFKTAIGAVTDLVSGALEARIGTLTGGINHEPLRRQLGTLEIPASQARAANP